MENVATLAKYYRDELYPFELIYRMMTCDKKEQSAESRSIGIQFQSDTSVYQMQDYKRDSCDSLKHKVLFSSSRFPESIHMAQFKEGKKLVRATKELVFDMDGTDFSRFCACRGHKRLCPACWFQIQGASLILEHLLENSLGYERRNCLWVFSGCKGLHCFVNAPNAMNLSDQERKQLHKRLSITAGDDARLVSFITALNKSDPEFVAQIEKFFVKHALQEQDLFSLPKAAEGEAGDATFEDFCLRYIKLRHNSFYHIVKVKWDEISLSPSPTKKLRLDESGAATENISMRKWKALMTLQSLTSKAPSSWPSIFIIFRMLYPVIDPAPLKLNHQIKLPFSVHAITRNVALPLKQADIMRMNIKTDTLSINDLCKKWVANAKTACTPPAFREGLRLLERWIEAYNNDCEFIEVEERK